MGHLWIPRLVLVPTVLSPAPVSQLVEEVSLSPPCSDVPGPLGKVVMSNLYPEQRPPRGRTKIVSPEMRKARLRVPGRPPAPPSSRASAGPSASHAGQGRSCWMDPAPERPCAGREAQRFWSRWSWSQVV